MKHSCQMIEDLLPLYVDGVCSGASVQVIEEHLTECRQCRDLLKKLQSKSYDETLHSEMEHVIDRHTKAIKTKSFVAGTVVAGILLIPVLVCLICNLATGHALDWFFIVLASLALFASVTVVPLMVSYGRKVFWTVISLTASTLLLLVTCIYSGGSWFLIAAASTLLGICVLFLPYILSCLPLKGFCAKNRGLISMAIDTILLYCVVLFAGEFASAPYYRSALLITTVCVLFVWLLFVIARYLKTNGWVKSGLIAALSCVFAAVINDVISWILYGIFQLSVSDADLSRWDTDLLINANIYVILAVAGLVFGTIFVGIGIARRKIIRERKSKKKPN